MCSTTRFVFSGTSRKFRQLVDHSRVQLHSSIISGSMSHLPVAFSMNRDDNSRKIRTIDIGMRFFRITYLDFFSNCGNRMGLLCTERREVNKNSVTAAIK